MSLGDMDITAEDLPRLLSEGTGLVVGGSSDGCDAPKLLDTSGDTSDLSEMLFKLQEATASISQSQNNLTSQMYQESVNGGTSQLQDYSTVSGTLNPHHTPNLGLKLHAQQNAAEPSMPLLTFSGALNSDFHGDAGLSASVTRSEVSSKINAMLGEVTSQQNGGVKDTEGERINISFGNSNLGMSEFEDLLKR